MSGTRRYHFAVADDTWIRDSDSGVSAFVAGYRILRRNGIRGPDAGGALEVMITFIWPQPANALPLHAQALKALAVEQAQC